MLNMERFVRLSLKTYVFRLSFPESTQERRREELPRILIRSTSMAHDVYICYIFVYLSQSISSKPLDTVS